MTTTSSVAGSTNTGLSVPGISSGLDVNGIVTQLMTIEQRPLDVLKQRAADYQTNLSAYGQLSSQLASLQSAAAGLAQASSWGLNTATVADSAIANATAGTAAVPGNYSINVSLLAQTHKLASAAKADSSTVIGDGTLQFEVGTYDPSGNIFTPSAGTSPVSVTIAPGSDSLAAIRDAVNAANAGVRASIVTDVNGARLVFTSTTSGAAGSLRISATDGDGNNTDAAGLSALAFNPAASAGSGKNLTQTQVAQDAQLTVDGLAVTSSTNTLTSVIEGVTLNLTAKSTSGPTQLAVAQNRTGITNMVNGFITAYNNAANSLKSLTNVDPTGVAPGALQGDQIAVSMITALRSAVTQSVSGIASGPSTLSQVGIEMQRDGTLKLNSAKFNSAMESGTDKVVAMFSTAGSAGNSATHGVALRLREMLDTALGSNGSLKTRTTGLQTRLKSNSTDQDRMNARLAIIEKNLRAQYTTLDTQMAKMQAVSSALTQQIAQINANTASGK